MGNNINPNAPEFATGPVTIWGIWGKGLEINCKKVTVLFLCTCDVILMASKKKVLAVS